MAFLCEMLYMSQINQQVYWTWAQASNQLHDLKLLSKIINYYELLLAKHME